MKAFRLILLSLSIPCSMSARAAPTILEAWEQQYPESTSSRIACQLCHERTDGGDGWNEYGWAIRVRHVEDGFKIEAAFRLVESLDSDFDSDSLNNITEINRSMFPGWVNANTNTIYYKDGDVKRNQTSPVTETDPTRADDTDCITIATKKNSVVLVCL